MIGIVDALTREIHRLATHGLTGTQTAAVVLPQGSQALDVLERGLAPASALEAHPADG